MSKKITQLTDATSISLAGSEKVPVVQSGETKQVSVSLLKGFHGCMVSRNSGTGNIFTTGNWIVVPWNERVYDTLYTQTGGSSFFWDESTNTSRLTVPAGVSFVRLTGSMQFSTTLSGGNQRTIYKNGTGFKGFSYARFDSWTLCNVFSSPVLPVIEGDYFEFLAYQASGSSKAMQTSNYNNSWFALEVVG